MERVVLITGACGGLGKALAGAFLAAGDRVVAVCRSEERLSALRAALASDRLEAIPADVTDEAAVDALFRQVLDRHGRLDVLVHGAGEFALGAVEESPVAVFDALLAANARSTFLLTRAAARVMKRNGKGRIIHVSARQALRGEALFGPFSASKSAMDRITEAAAAELRDDGITVNAVLPATIDTPKNRQAMPEADTGRWIDPEDVARVVLFLASDDARAVTGALIPIHGRQ
ncbi:SDR family NAD(P)-dependent oxidoreductase [Caldinitratiruptor microaerophilus]|uniref:Short-chain dehydrogenase n=1 Tax=Caldinitratiruptor microaerophilus TaxID=671077 RepID=A0AA35CK51_9FIRM|nr:SDR family NAD(P)-dependent oxidoreductase [Caldinitratiruptor microaerophilus]BDG60794.1 short-chain dehydrogenase [Caldinitratiruptor microaerophilus]